jgi:hypothetical protein
MPIIPPIAVKNIEDTSNNPAPHKVGIKPPIVEPIAMKIQIVDFELINELY